MEERKHGLWNQVELRLQQIQHKPAHLLRDLPHLAKLSWRIDQRWHDEAGIPRQNYQLLFSMVWNQPEPEHLQVLLQHTKEQRELHQSTSFAAETEMYREWQRHPSKAIAGFSDV